MSDPNIPPVGEGQDPGSLPPAPIPPAAPYPPSAPMPPSAPTPPAAPFSAAPPPPPPPGSFPPPAGFGAAPLPGGAHAGSPTTFSATDAFVYGWNGLTKNIGPLIVIALLIFLVQGVATFLQQGFNSFILSILASVIATLLSLILSLGLIRAALIIVDGRHPKVEDVISTQDLVPYILASILVTIGVVIGTLLCIIPGILVAYLLQFYGYAIVDRKVDAVNSASDADPLGAIRASFEITTKHVGGLILLLLLILVANVIGALACGLGLLITMPVSAIAIAYAWRFFTNGPIAPVAA